MNKNDFLKPLFLIFLLIFALQCMPPTPAKVEPTQTTLSYVMPDVNILPGYSELQEKQELSISAIPITFKKIKKIKRKCEWDPGGLAKLMMNENELKPNDKTFYKVRETPYFEVEPSALAFNIRIYNHLDHVIRLEGAVVAFRIDGRMVNIDRANYQEFLAGIIIPRGEDEYPIYGPMIESLPSSCNIALLLYDVVTQTDDAGNPTKKSNFEWVFTYKEETKEERVNLSIKRIYMTPVEARALEIRD
ncbi:MAG: hypothetical protein ACFFCQ_16880 [Promethearchaeota archaeon]